MKKFIFKFSLYIILILLALELLVRVFHLYTEDPPRFIDEHGVEKRVPQNDGYAVFGNRNQSFSEFRINNAGFNSHREFNPSPSKFEIALVGDSFIEGFHQDYEDSIGKKIERTLEGAEVYEYGYSGYDFANKIHLIHAYKKEFELIDEIIIYFNYEIDLPRGEYTPNYDRIKMLNSPLFKIRDNIKLLAYGSKIGVLEPLKKLVTGQAFEDGENGYQTNEIKIQDSEEERIKNLQHLNNFKNLVNKYGLDKEKVTFLLDSRKTDKNFLTYLNEQGIKVLDYSIEFEKSKKSVTLIYDWHWNDYGRELIANVISDYIKDKKKI